jgi:type II secretory pathway pseudopilin PulG
MRQERIFPSQFSDKAGRPARGSEAGVTLIEMLVASIVMLFVMAGLAVILVSTTKIQAYQNELAEAQQNMRIVLSTTGDRIARAGTGLMPRTLAFQTSQEAAMFDYVANAMTKGDLDLVQDDLLFGVYYQRDFPSESAGAGAPILQPLSPNLYGSFFGWQGNEVTVAARTGLVPADWAAPGLPLLLFNANLGNVIVNDAIAPIISPEDAKLNKLYTKAFHLTRLTNATENILDGSGNPSNAVSSIQILHPIAKGAHPNGWVEGKASAGGDTPILAYVGVAHAVFAYKQEILLDGTPGGEFYMAEFTPGATVAEGPQGSFAVYAENIYDLEAWAVFSDPGDGTAIRARLFPPPLDPVTTSQAASSGNVLADHYRNRVNLREVEITVTVRTGEPVPAGKAPGLFVPVTKAGYETGFVYRVVRGSTRSHMQAFYLNFSAKAGVAGG